MLGRKRLILSEEGVGLGLALQGWLGFRKVPIWGMGKLEEEGRPYSRMWSTCGPWNQVYALNEMGMLWL